MQDSELDQLVTMKRKIGYRNESEEDDEDTPDIVWMRIDGPA